MIFDWVHILGYAAFVTGLLSYVVKKQNQTRFLLGSASLLLSAHFYLLGAITTSSIQVVMALRSWISMLLNDQKKKTILFFVIVAIISTITYVSWSGWKSIIPFLAALNSTYAICCTSNSTMRKLQFITSFFWIVNGIIWMSWPQILSEGLKVIINCYTIWVLHQQEKSDNEVALNTVMSEGVKTSALTRKEEAV